MKGLVKFAQGADAVEIREIPKPTVKEGHVLIASRAVGVCGSDIHMWKGHQSWDVKVPVVLGHETAGVIAEVGEGVTDWKVGDRVVCETAAVICGVCALCRSGRYNLCPHREGYGAIRDGAFSEFLVAEERVLHHIPAELSFEQAALTEPFAVAFNAVVERARVLPGDIVVIQGAGAIGLLCLQIALLQGAGCCVVLGTAVDKNRLKMALEMGADYAIDISQEDPLETVMNLGDGLGADLVVDATGVSLALKDAMEMARPLGSIVKVGWGPQPLDYSLDTLVAKALTLYGSFSHTWTTWERVLNLFATDKLLPASVIGGVYPIEDWAKAFSDMAEGKNIKSVMTF